MEHCYNEFEVGDEVQIVTEPYSDCPFAWAPLMNDYLGKTAVILQKCWSENKNTFWYHIDKDNERFIWCGNCFYPKTVRDFEPAEHTALVALLGM